MIYIVYHALLISILEFKQPSFESIVNMIAHEMQVLLEVVNYNVEGQQYVCAGHVSFYIIIWIWID
jgi:malonyl CoA-acyl carrier protein transacylase